MDNNLRSESYSEACQIYKIKRFAEIVNGFQRLTFFTKRFSLDVWQGSENASGDQTDEF